MTAELHRGRGEETRKDRKYRKEFDRLWSQMTLPLVIFLFVKWGSLSRKFCMATLSGINAANQMDQVSILP